MLAHGISTGGLFLGVGVLYERRHTRASTDFGGLWKRMPVFAALFLVIVLASVGLPGLCGFVGEFLILLGTFNADHDLGVWRTWRSCRRPSILAVIAASAVILAAMYLLTMYQKIFFGPLDKPENQDHARARRPRAREAGCSAGDRRGAGDGPVPEADPRALREVGGGDGCTSGFQGSGLTDARTRIPTAPRSQSSAASRPPRSDAEAAR